MTFPITTAVAAALSLILIVLTYAVILSRARTRVGLGDGGNDGLLLAIRRQANFVENVPFTLILLALAEARGGNPTVLACLGALLVAARLLHPLGLKAGVLIHPLRFFGTAATTGVQLALVTMLLLQF